MFLRLTTDRKGFLSVALVNPYYITMYYVSNEHECYMIKTIFPDPYTELSSVSSNGRSNTILRTKI